MPDSLITKRALASSLKELMKTQPLTKISVGDICEKMRDEPQELLLSFLRQI